jgi:hypothetical protein
MDADERRCFFNAESAEGAESAEKKLESASETFDQLLSPEGRGWVRGESLKAKCLENAVNPTKV